MRGKVSKSLGVSETSERGYLVVECRPLVEGVAEGSALVSREPISFYGGVDPETGIVRERGHPLEGECVADRVLIFPYGKGSTVGSYVILELARRKRAPKAIVNLESEQIVIIGCLLAGIPLVDKPRTDVLELVESGDRVRVVSRRESAYIVLRGEER